MNEEPIRNMLLRGEDATLEFKEAQGGVPKNLFETVCAMLNSQGGDILLGINDAGGIVGIPKSKAKHMKQDIISSSCNPQKLTPTHTLKPDLVQLDGKTVIHIQVNCSAQLHSTNGKFYERGGEGDHQLSDSRRIIQLANAKGAVPHDDAEVHEHANLSGFDLGALARARTRGSLHSPGVNWDLPDEDLLRHLGLWREDPHSGKSGFTMAGIMLFGSPELIRSTAKCHKVDALVRRSDTSRYDHRQTIEDNLINTHAALMEFTAKHLPNPFHLIARGAERQRVDLRASIFGEVVSNMLAHRNYHSEAASQFIVYYDHVEAVNAFRMGAEQEGTLAESGTPPRAKNPLIAKVLRLLGYAEDAGTGIPKLRRDVPEYSLGREPVFMHRGELFIATIPVRITSPAPDGGNMIRDENGVVRHERGMINGENGALNAGANYERGMLNGGTRENGIINGSRSDVVRRVMGREIQRKGLSLQMPSRNHMAAILLLALRNHGTKGPEVQSAFRLSQRQAQRHLKTLQSLGLIKYHGARKNGRYVISSRLERELAAAQAA